MPGRSRTGTVSILIADDHAVVRAVSALCWRRSPSGRWSAKQPAAGCCGNGISLRPMWRVLDISMPGLNGSMLPPHFQSGTDTRDTDPHIARCEELIQRASRREWIRVSVPL